MKKEILKWKNLFNEEPERTNHKETMVKACMANKFLLLYAGEEFQTDPTTVVALAGNDYNLAFFVCSNAENNDKDGKIKALKNVFEDFNNFFELPSNLFEDKKFVNLCIETIKDQLSYYTEDVQKNMMTLVNKNIELAQKTNELNKRDRQIQPILNNKEETRKNMISKALYSFGANPANLGFKYSRDAVMILLDDPSKTKNIMKGVYSEIAKLHNSTIQRVERGIRHLIQSLENPKQANEYFGYQAFGKSGTVPTSKNFLSSIMLQIQEREKQAERITYREDL